MKQRIRTFVAVPISDTVRQAAARLVGKFRATPAEVKWVEAENMHLTVQFLGDVDARQIHAVCRAVEAAVADQGPFDLAIQGVGAFPDLRRPRTLWVGAGEGAEAMGDLAHRIAAHLQRLGYRRQNRPFHPHLTIGRVRRAGTGLAQLVGLLQEYQDSQLGRTRVCQVVTFSSQLDRSGPRYEALGSARLATA